MAVLTDKPANKRSKAERDAIHLSEIEPASRRRTIRDEHPDAPRGFALRVDPSGVKSFVLRYKVAGRDRVLTIGQHPTWGLTSARDQGRDYRQRIDTGEDIIEERRAQRAEPTVRDVAQRYLAARVAGLSSERNIRALFDHHIFPAFGRRKIADVRRRDVIALVERVAGDRPRQAGMILTYTKQLFEYAEDREIIEANPVATLKPQKVSKSMAPQTRTRVLDDDELAAFWHRAETCGLRRLTALALQFVLVTGQRPGEVAGIRDVEIDGDAWTIPAERRGKTDSALTVPLTATAQRILEAARDETQRLMPRRSRSHSDHIFQTRPAKPITTTSMSRAVLRYAERLGSKDDPAWGQWRPHDLRRTCRTALSAAGVSELVAELTIGHTRKGIAAVYDQHAYLREKRAALEAWERRLLRIVDGEPADENVVPIAKR